MGDILCPIVDSGRKIAAVLKVTTIHGLNFFLSLRYRGKLVIQVIAGISFRTVPIHLFPRDKPSIDVLKKFGHSILLDLLPRGIKIVSNFINLRENAYVKEI